MKKSGTAGMVARYSGIILLLPACMLIGYRGGFWLDTRFETEPVLSLVGMLIGSGAGLMQVFRMVRKGP